METPIGRGKKKRDCHRDSESDVARVLFLSPPPPLAPSLSLSLLPRPISRVPVYHASCH